MTPSSGPSAIEAVARHQLGPRRGLAAQVGGVVGCGEGGVVARIPEARIDAVEDAHVVVAPGAQGIVETSAELGRQRFAGVGGAHGVDDVGAARCPRAADPRHRRAPTPSGRSSCQRAESRRPAVIGQVVAGQHRSDRGQQRHRQRSDDATTASAGPACQSWPWMMSTGRASTRMASSAARPSSVKRAALSG